MVALVERFGNSSSDTDSPRGLLIDPRAAPSLGVKPLLGEKELLSFSRSHLFEIMVVSIPLFFGLDFI